jgi:hypothetical protein
MREPHYRFLRTRCHEEHAAKAQAGLAWFDCAACGGGPVRHPYVLTTLDARSYIYALCDPCHRGMNAATDARARPHPDGASPEEGVVGSLKACGAIVAAVDEALDRFVACGEPEPGSFDACAPVRGMRESR